MNCTEHKQALIDQRRAAIECHELDLKRLDAKKQLLDLFDDTIDLPSSITGYARFIDFDSPTHEQRITIMQRLQLGKWEKEVNSDSMNYVAKWGEWTIRLYGAPLLPCCRIEEVFEFVPASYRKVRRVICPDPTVLEAVDQEVIKGSLTPDDQESANIEGAIQP